MYVIVTGSSGKLGQQAVAALRRAKHRVVGLDLVVPLRLHRFRAGHGCPFGD